MPLPDPLDALPRSLLTRILERCVSEEPDPLAVLVTGSYAAGTAAEGSDLDLSVLLEREPPVGYRTWFEDRPGRPLHVSAGFESLAAWLRRYDEPARWSLGFPTDTAARVLWATEAGRAALPDPPNLRRPAGDAELEDFVESASKVRRAIAAGDGMGARFHAHGMAELAPSLLFGINAERRVRDRRDALDAAMSFPHAPEHYRQDFIACFGLAAVPDGSFERSALRMPLEMLAFLRARRPDVDRQPWLSRYLADGTLERHLEW